MILNVQDIPAELRAGFLCVAPLLPLSEGLSAVEVTIEKRTQPGFSIHKSEGQIKILYHQKVEFFRALSLLAQHAGSAAFELAQASCFSQNGVMIDCSRNAVPKPDFLREILKSMALMGLNWAMLYTEDTYEIDGEPYFGYLRGRYSFEELRALDDFAFDLGIELIPCIQTLAHLECALRWSRYDMVRDTDRSLMVGREETYALLEKMIAAACAPYRSKRIHIGMDEAWELGLGNYLSIYGYKPCAELMAEHLSRVEGIIKRQGLTAMMWSDMHFYAASPTRSLYSADSELTAEMLAAAPKDIALVYWDYYHETEASYETVLKLHQKFEAPTVFAGGIWTWNGPCVDYRKTIAATIPALEQCRKQNVREVIATVWGDDGAETNLATMLYGLQIFAEFGYTACYNEEMVKARFAVCCGAQGQAFIDLSRMNELPGVLPEAENTVNPTKNLLYEDPLLPLFEVDFKEIPTAEHYTKLSNLYQEHAKDNPAFSRLFLFYAALARAIYHKCVWRDSAAACVRAKDKVKIAQMPDKAELVIASLEALRVIWMELWYATNKPFGFEVIDLRLGGLIARFETARKRFIDLRDGAIADIVELSTQKLPYLKQDDGSFEMLNHWMPTVTPGHFGMK